MGLTHFLINYANGLHGMFFILIYSLPPWLTTNFFFVLVALIIFRCLPSTTCGQTYDALETWGPNIGLWQARG